MFLPQSKTKDRDAGFRCFSEERPSTSSPAWLLVWILTSSTWSAHFSNYLTIVLDRLLRFSLQKVLTTWELPVVAFRDTLYLLFPTFYFVLGHSQLATLRCFQVNEEETQPHIHMHPFFPKLPFHPGRHATLSRVPRAAPESLLVIRVKQSCVHV